MSSQIASHTHWQQSLGCVEVVTTTLISALEAFTAKHFAQTQPLSRTQTHSRGEACDHANGSGLKIAFVCFFKRKIP